MASKKKPGWKTSEAWLSLIAIIGAWVTANDVAASSSTATKVVALICSALAAAGYTASRTSLKRESGDAGGS